MNMLMDVYKRVHSYRGNATEPACRYKPSWPESRIPKAEQQRLVLAMSAMKEFVDRPLLNSM